MEDHTESEYKKQDLPKVQTLTKNTFLNKKMNWLTSKKELKILVRKTAREKNEKSKLLSSVFFISS